MTLIGQVAGIVSMIIYGVFILLAIVALIIVVALLYKFVMWILYATSSEDKKKEDEMPNTKAMIGRQINSEIEKEIKEGERLEKLAKKEAMT